MGTRRQTAARGAVGLLAACLLAAGAAEPVKGAATPVPAGAAKATKEFLRSRFVRDIDVAGTVVDRQVTPLDGVKLLVDVSDRKGKRYETLAANGSFALNYANTIDCVIWVSKPGYYGEQTTLFRDDLVTGASKDGHTLVGAKDMRIVLEEIGPATPMLSFEPDCEFRITGEWRVNQLVAEKDGKRELQKSPVWHKLDMTGRGVDALPPHCPYVRADVQDGRIVPADQWIRKTCPGGSDNMDPATTPARVYLGITGPGNGVVLFNPGSDRQGDPSIEMRAMKEAPETGYTQEILLDQSTHQYAYFYLKIGDWYGKGSILLNVQRHDPTYLSRPALNLWVQPDGSRNVRSMK